MNSYRVILADDHTMMREGLKRILAEKSDLEVIGEAADGLELLNLLQERQLRPDMIILDLSMPNLRGLEAIKKIKRVDREIKILVLTMYKDEGYLCQALRYGADGFLLKEDADRELFFAIERVQGGEIYLSPYFSDKLTPERIEQCKGTGKSVMEEERLSQREKEVLKLVAEGKSSKDIAQLLQISSRTVEHHRAHIMTKLNAKRTADIVKYAMQKGYVEPEVIP